MLYVDYIYSRAWCQHTEMFLSTCQCKQVFCIVTLFSLQSLMH